MANHPKSKTFQALSESLGWRIVDVVDENLAKEFLMVNARLNQADEAYIMPLNKDIEEVFDPKRNKAFRHGEAKRWLLMDAAGQYAGRIAAFVNRKYKNKGDTQKTGGMGFFDCPDDQEAANLLLDTARDWLASKGMEAMDGPINFGERDKWWGLLIEGFYPPLYGMNYNPPYYRELLENYGFQLFYRQICWKRSVEGRLSQKFYDVHDRLIEKGGFEARRIRKKQLEKYALDFMRVYNRAWASHQGNKEISHAQAVQIFKAMAPVMDENVAWMAYHNNEPIAMYISIPDLNQIFRHFQGKLGWWEKLKFLYYKWRGECSSFVGIIFGVVPEYQGMGIDRFLVVEAAKVIQPMGRYKSTELQWQGDFNPKMLNISKELDFEKSRELAVFRYLFDREKPFVRHPIL